MKPLATRIKGFGPHSDTLIDWQAAGRLVALVGANGAGKTTALTSPFAGAYVDYPSQPVSFADCTPGFAQEAVLENDYEHGGQVLHSVVTIKNLQGARPETKACLYNAEGDMIAGPKLGDYKARIESLFGTADLALATSLAAQHRKGDLSTVKASERRGILAGLLNFKKLDAMSERAKNRARDAAAEADLLEKQLVGVDSIENQRRGHEEDLRQNREKLTAVTASIATLRTKLEKAQAELAQIDGNDEQFRVKIREHEAAAAELSRKQEELRRLKQRCAELRENADKVDEAKRAEAAAQRALATVNRLTQQARQFRAWQQWKSDDARLDAELRGKRELVETLESQPGLDDATRELAATVDAIGAEYRRAEAENKERAQRNQARETKRGNLRMDLQRVDDELARLRNRLSGKPKTPGEPDVCNTCPLLREFADIPAEIAKAEQRQAELAAATVEEDEPLHDLGEIKGRGIEARAAETAVKNARESQLKLEAARAELAAAEERVAKHRKSVPVEVDDPTRELNDASEEERRHAALARNLALYEQAAQDLAHEEQRRATLEAELQAAISRESELKTARTAAEQTLASREERRTALQNAVKALQSEIRVSQTELDRLNREIGRLEQALADLDKRQQETEEKRQKAAGLRKAESEFRTLARVFGEKGVQAILLDEGFAMLDKLAEPIMRHFFPDRTMTFLTQKANKDGGTREEVQILVNDPASGRTRDILTYSGGEATILRLVVRLTVVQWASRLRGVKPESLFLDEAFDALDTEAKDKVIELLHKLLDTFKLIVVITHDEAIAAKLPGQIRLTKHFGGVTVESRGGAQNASVA